MLRDWLGDWVGTFLGHKGAVWCGKLSGGDASIAVTGSADFSAKVWDTFTGDCLHTFPHNHIVRTVAIDAEGKNVLTGGHEKKLRLFDLHRPDAEAQLFVDKTPHTRGSSRVVFGTAPSPPPSSAQAKTASFVGGTLEPSPRPPNSPSPTPSPLWNALPAS